MPSAVSYRLGTDSKVIFIPEQNRLIIDEEGHSEDRHLEPLQARMLSFFIQHQGKVQSARTIAEAVWDRSQVSDNLVRQVISQLRSQLNDQERPYAIIKTIPKQGYLFDIEVIEQEIPSRLSSDNLSDNSPKKTPEKLLTDPAVTTSQACPSKVKTNTVKTALPMNRLMIFSIIIAVLLTISTGISYFSQSNNEAIGLTTSENKKVIPIIFHDIELDQNRDLTIARNVYNYLFFGLNSSNNIVGYHYSQLTPAARKQLTPDAISLKGWIKETKSGYHLKLLIDIPSHSGEIKKLDVTFTKDNFFSAIGDLVLSLKTTISPATPDYSFANHRVTSVQNYNDWQAISKGISLFYQGKGAESFKGLSSELEMIKRQGRDNYLLEALFSYISSMNSLNTSSSEDKRLALSYAKEAFEKNPRCNIANISLGLALIVNNQSEQAYPYLFYAAENSPSPLSYYLLSIADQQANNPKGAEYNYQRFNRLSKGQKSQLAELKASLQKSNLFPTAKQVD
ncbi:transcriptional regulator [Photobacterium sanguinicancri]|uniref:Transcriptional regulator n=1 Tax=Photobacterium sanguinicancri TaxID=875932 RepID=A0ABX4FTQ9_9GAMM|nr:winged helix-turn-helix domain-containing protein [Photobacterium sanguinicancri]OZS42239.1 transcriptional regulator [Photobacterium sanguinicancri]